MEHNYEYIDGKLMYEEYGNTKLYFSYDAFGNPYSVRALAPGYNGYYYYALNWRGDVEALYDEYNNVICRYEYDAWGNSPGPLNSLGNVITYDGHIGNFNPLRYRGYYYDTESELYYLGSRYYDPKMFRFVNADTTELLTTSPMSLDNKNLFAYCNNNPVMFMDTNGHSAVVAVLIGAGIAGLVTGFISGAMSMNNPETSFGWAFLGGFVNGAFGTVAVAGAISLGLPIAGVAGVGALGGMIGYATESTISGTKITNGGLISSAVFGALNGLTAGAFSSVTNGLHKSIANEIAQEGVFDYVTTLASDCFSAISNALLPEESTIKYTCRGTPPSNFGFVGGGGGGLFSNHQMPYRVLKMGVTI